LGWPSKAAQIGPLVTLDGFYQACGTMKAACMVVQWQGAHVWKVGNKMFAVAFRQRQIFACSLKASELTRQVYAGHRGIIPAPYLARVGWLRFEDGALPDADLVDLIRVSHALVVAGLPKNQRMLLQLG
jgi:predicted DNA-binding protein (MmcQ/YjbR family)